MEGVERDTGPARWRARRGCGRVLARQQRSQGSRGGNGGGREAKPHYKQQRGAPNEDIHQVLNFKPPLVFRVVLAQGVSRGTQEGCRSSALFSILYLYESEGVVREKCRGVGTLSLYLYGCCYILRVLVSIRGSYLQYFTWYSICQLCLQFSEISSLTRGFVALYLYRVLQFATGYRIQLDYSSNQQRKYGVQASVILYLPYVPRFVISRQIQEETIAKFRGPQYYVFWHHQ